MRRAGHLALIVLLARAAARWDSRANMATTTPPVPTPTVPTNTPAIAAASSSLGDDIASSVTIKPGASTTEFWFSFLVIAFGLLMASGLLTTNKQLQIVSFVGALVKSGLYLWSRTKIKVAASSAASTVVVLIAFAFGLHTLTACGGSLGSDVKAEGKVALDCVHAESARSAIAEYGPMAAQLAFSAVQGNGQVLKDQLMSDFSSAVSDAAKCVALDAVAKLTKPTLAGSGAAASSAQNADPASAREALAALKSQLAPGREVILPGEAQ